MLFRFWWPVKDWYDLVLVRVRRIRLLLVLLQNYDHAGKVDDCQHLFDFGPVAVRHSCQRLHEVLRTPRCGIIPRCNHTNSIDTG